MITYKVKCLNCQKIELVSEDYIDFWICYCGSESFEIIS